MTGLFIRRIQMNNPKTIEERVKTIKERARKISNKRAKDTFELEKKLEINERVQVLLEELDYQLNNELLNEDDLQEILDIIEYEMRALEKR